MSTNPFDEFRRAQPAANPFDEFQPVGPTARQTLTTAVTMKPDSVAEAARLAKRYPAPPEVIMQDLEAYRLQEVLDLADTDLQKAPMLREIMRRDVKVAAMAQDDIPMLTRVAQAARDVANIGKAGVFGASRGVAGTARAGLELVAPVLDVLEPLDPNATSPGLIPRVAFPGGNPLRRLAEGFGMQAAAAGRTADAAMPRYESTLGQGVASGLRSLTQNLMTLPMAFLPGGQGAALAGMTTFTGGDAYQQAREKGIPMSQALPFAASQAAVEYATEKLPLAALLKDVKAGAGFLQILGRQIALEVPGEQVATLLQDLNEWAVINPEKPFSSYLEERPNAAAQTLIATIVGTGGNVAVVKGIERLVERATRDGTNMQRAGLTAQALEQAMQGAEASRLRERNPEAFRDVMAQMSQDGSIYIDAEVLNQMPPELLQQMQGVIEALPDALAANSSVEVKLADALTVLPGTPQAEVFMQNARSAPDAPSLVEAEAAGAQAQQFLQQEAERVIAQAQDQEAMRASSEAVRQSILGELNTAGRYRGKVNEGMASWASAFYTAYSSRLGITPEEMYQRYRLRVLGQATGQGEVLNAGEQKPGQLDGVEAYHWSMAARPTLSSAFYGTGLKGSARDEIMSYPDQRVRQRLSFYVDKGTGVRPEAGVGGVAHRATLNNIYDANLDPLKLRGGNAREFETRVLDAGFDGYLDRLEGDQPGQVILLGDRTLQPEVLGPLSRVESGQQVPALARREAPWQTQASGTPEQLQARLERMQSSPAWGDYDLRIEGSELQVRKRGGVFEQKAKEPDSNVKLPKKASTTTAVDLRNGPRLTGSQKMSIHEVAAFFDKITGKRDFNDPKEQKRAIKQIVAELQYQLQREQSGLDWYEGDIKAAFETTARVIPSLAENAIKRQLFAVVAGLQSPGTLADMNWDIAAQTFQHYEKTGTIPGRNPANGNLWAGGPVSANKEKALEFLNAMVQDLGEQGTVEWLYSEHTVKELNEARKKWGNMGPGVDGKASDLKLGMFAFGPKVGPFVMNINGIHELTVDLWATRSFNRYFGQMTGPDGKIVDAPTEPQRRVVKELFNAAAEQVGIKPYQVQSVLWFFEQQLFNHLGTGSASLSFSDGARKFAERSLPAPGRDGGPATLQQGDLSGRPQQAGDGAGRYSSGGLAPLEGAPTVAGAAGPDPRLVAVAEQYARDNGIPLRRQAAYAKVDPERAARIAAAYEAMPHAPQDPAVREAYDDLARQTMAQYQALVEAGYQFWFMDPAADPYQGNPWNAMRDLRANQSMAVFPTESGFGTGEFDPEGNPLLADTGLEWAYGSPDGQTKRVLFNDLFRAVHDAFGHGLEGAGFRAQGEENAWQAHVRLFTGPAVGAITSETRGQNSWLNYGPNGEANQKAKVEDTVFADQKTGLMPEWTWSEGIVEDTPEQPLQQGPRGTFNPRTLELVLSPTADLSTFFHETGHFFLEVLADIASQPGAPAQIVEDMGAFLKWSGLPDLATWNGYSLEQKRPYHERWAEGIEQYVMEGKAPNTELQPLMRRFSAWLKSVYKSVTQFVAGKPELELNDDIRRVMDRMLATDEQIQQANEVAGLVPDEQADGEAAERLQKRSMADLKWAVRARDAVIAKLKKQAREIEKATRAEVTVEVDQMPEMRAKAALDALAVTPEYAGILAEHKAQRQAAETQARQEITDAAVAAEEAKGGELKGLKKGQFLAKMKREIGNQVEARMIEWDRANPRPARPVNATDQDVATIADSFGFESVDAMLQAIDAFGPRAEAIDGLTEQRMLEENGDLIDERAIQEAANEAVHNEARARSLATELRTQREMLGQRTDTGETNARGARITVNALIEAAKQFGANVIARTPLKDLKATAWKHTAAERRAGKRWAEATAKGETADAVKAKQDQVLNNAAAKAALDATNEAKKILEFFKRVTKGNDEKTVEKGRDPDIVNAARAALAAYGIQTPASKGAVAYLEAVKANDPDTYSAIEPMIAAATQNTQPLEALTFEELQGLHESIQAMWFLAKRSRQMEVAGDLLDIDDVADEVYTRLEEIGIPDRVPGEGMAVTRGEERTLFLQQGIAFLRRVEQWAEGMDGKYGGPFLRFIFQPIKDAADRYRKDRVEYRKKFQALVDNLAPIVGDSVIQAPELGYTFGTPGSTAGTAMNEILHAVLHTGNDSNKRKLLLGRGWATENPDGTLDTSRWDAFLGRLVNEGKLEQAHFDFVQGVWDLLEQTKPLAQKAHRDAFGRYFSEVTANAFVDPFGVTRRGGYVPAQVDSRLVKDNALRKLAEEENNSMAYAFPQPAMGFTKGRTEYNKPLMLDLRTLSQHLDKVLLFSHMTNPARDVRKLLMRPKVSQPLNRVQPAAVESMLQPWLQRSAQQIVEDPIVGSGKWARIPGVVRSRAGMALMFANVSNAIQQVTGLASAAVRVKPAYLMRSLAQYVASPVKFSQAVWGASPYMDDRAKNEVAVMNEQMQAILIKPSTFQKAQDFSMRHAYFLQTALDNVLSPIVWSGALNQALADGTSEQDAIRFADSTVRQTQGSTLPEDVSRFETGPAYARAFTQFVSYFNMMANTNGTALKQIADEVGLKKGAGKALYVVMMGFMAPIWVAEAIAQAFRGGPEDEDDDGYLDDWLAAVFGMGTLKGLLAQIPILGQFGVAAANRFNDNPLDDRVSLSPAISLLESSVSAPESVYKAIVEDGSAQKAIRDVATLVSVATGVPVYGLARPLGYAAGVAQGKIEPTSEADFVRGLVTGTASPESKVR